MELSSLFQTLTRWRRGKERHFFKTFWWGCGWGFYSKILILSLIACVCLRFPRVIQPSIHLSIYPSIHSSILSSTHLFRSWKSLWNGIPPVTMPRMVKTSYRDGSPICKIYFRSCGLLFQKGHLTDTVFLRQKGQCLSHFCVTVYLTTGGSC